MGDTTFWRCSVDQNTKRASLQWSLDGTSFQPYVIKGVCYSPAPINGSNKFGPNLGDWYWDAFDSTANWEALWKRDIHNVRRNLNANSMRIYCAISRQIDYRDGSIPVPWNSGHLFTHNEFLDWCWNGNAPIIGRDPLCVLVGVPIPSDMLSKNKYDRLSIGAKSYWMEMLRETAQTMGKHPAVMGFTIQNEQDNPNDCYDDPELAKFWWSQVETLASLVKTAAPGKLVGMATFDNPDIPRKAAGYMAKCPSIDFWGVNTYQTETFEPVFAPYRNLSGPALKPVILTEFGLPATGRRNQADPASIYDDATTRQKTANVIANMLPKIFQDPISVGVYYFEYCDEWWNQPEAPNISTWYSGKPAGGFPNGFWDNDGFGLYAVQRGAGLPNDAPIWEMNGPTLPVDTHTERKELTGVVAKVFGSVR